MNLPLIYIIKSFELEAVEDDDNMLFSLMKVIGVAADATFFTRAELHEAFGLTNFHTWWKC